MSLPVQELESMKETLTKALQIVDSLKHQPQEVTVPNKFQEDEVLTIPKLRRRLGISKENMSDILSEPGCPVFTLGGPRQRRVIWSEFVEWSKQRGA
ncbi:hypothetical protein [Paenibacillus thiaminolyticus]|uniref:Uncharacterized protein n=1 Tax=Paenibacillus thiaminolyticus TaxID=49283 RepID=A0A3A3GSW6_PANTH|nr:hypothetical protein [Paenibacillus thiaminolyticus]RJG26666.1 hypothetical protein DQX05_01135 [Paenibacillus thiaminolyticus]